MASAHWQISMLACLLLYSCSPSSSTLRPEKPLTVELDSTQEGSIAMEGNNVIEVTIKDRKVVTAPEDNPKAGVNRGDTVIWSFEVNVAEEKLAVRPKGSSSPFNTFPSPNQISGEIFLNNLEENGFDYEILMDNEPLVWANSSSGGCIKPIGGGGGGSRSGGA